MKLIGIKRALLLAILFAINLAIAGLFFFVIEPMRTGATEQLAGIEGQIAGLQSKIQNVKRELDDFNRNLPKYEELKTVGFFNAQDRFDLMRHLDDVRLKNNLQGFPFDVTEIKEISNSDAAMSQSRLIMSRINIKEVPVLVDNDFFQFVDVMKETFPAHVRLQSFKISRVNQFDAEFLKQIRKKEKNSAIVAKVEFDWLTIVPAADDKKPVSGWGGR
ncbi:MAG TPA: hypothetical protein PLX33_05850 [Alphaproteobacteria bacterium]|nr:hypothetical protein [Alphaproteobacteria bacterium]